MNTSVIVLNATELFDLEWFILCNVTIACIKINKKGQMVVERDLLAQQEAIS